MNNSVRIIEYVSISSMVRFSIASSSPFLAAAIIELRFLLLSCSTLTASLSFSTGKRILPSPASPDKSMADYLLTAFCFLSYIQLHFEDKNQRDSYSQIITGCRKGILIRMPFYCYLFLSCNSSSSEKG